MSPELLRGAKTVLKLSKKYTRHGTDFDECLYM